jgi:hypothetical protein
VDLAPNNGNLRRRPSADRCEPAREPGHVHRTGRDKYPGNIATCYGKVSVSTTVVAIQSPSDEQLDYAAMS